MPNGLAVHNYNTIFGLALASLRIRITKPLALAWELLEQLPPLIRLVNPKLISSIQQ